MNVLIDENISPTLVQYLAEKGVYAVHVAHVGNAGTTDPEVWKYAYGMSATVVTLNARDFLQLAEDSLLHAGLIVLRVPGLSAEEQWAHVEPVINDLLWQGIDPINQVVEIFGVGDFSYREVPPPS